MGLRAAVQINPVTLESVQRADRELRERKERLRKEVSDQSEVFIYINDQSLLLAVILPVAIQVEEEDRRLESLSFGERIKLVDQMRREVTREQNEKLDRMILESGYDL